MTKKRVESASENKPKVVDFDEQMDPAIRDFANRLQGLKSFCVENGIDFEEATAYYQALLSHPQARISLRDALDRTMAWAEGRAAREGLTEPLSPEDQEFYSQVAAIGFPKDRAREILNLAKINKLPDPYSAAFQTIANEMRATIAAQEEKMKKSEN